MEAKVIQLLLLEDNPGDARLIRELLSHHPLMSTLAGARFRNSIASSKGGSVCESNSFTIRFVRIKKFGSPGEIVS